MKIIQNCNFSWGLSEIDISFHGSIVVNDIFGRFVRQLSFQGLVEHQSKLSNDVVSSLWTHSNDPWNGTQRANESTCSCIFFVVCLTSRFRLKFIRCAAESCHVKARQSWERWKAVVECGRRLEKFFACFLTSLSLLFGPSIPIRTTTKRALLGHATLDIHSIRFF